MLRKSFIKEYFNFSRAERLGILGLSGCVLIMLTLKWSLPRWITPKAPDTTMFANEITKFRLAVDTESFTNDDVETSIYIQNIAELFYFDPNSATNDDWSRLGLNERQIRNIRNYQTAGGAFRRKEDLQRLYTISATLYRQLEPYIRIANNETSVRQAAREIRASSANLYGDETERAATSPQIEAKIHVELNSADSSLLTKLSGIGPVLAARTIRYRNLIGGFVDASQLSEVYGINSELVELLSEQLSIDSSLIRKIPVNTATFSDFVRHPYISEQQARGITNYRRLQNRINNIDELVRNNILEREDAEKVRAYLLFE